MKKHSIRLGIDLMGSDHTPEILLKATLGFATTTQDYYHYILVGTKPVQELFSELKGQYPTQSKITFQLAKHSIEMDEHPLVALKTKKNSTIYLGMKLLKEKKIDAFISAGNTGALLSSAKMYLSSLPNVIRPALLALLPTKKNPVAILDVGANVTCKSQNLVQFAHLGAAFQSIRGVEKPKVALLNIGTEAVKGTSELKKAYKTLTNLETESFEFVGNAEGRQAFEGEVDVLVTDGFTGNIFLKTSEGLANLVLDRLQDTVETDNLEDLKKYLHYEEYPGAVLVGTENLVIKCHGYSSPIAFKNGIRGAIQLIHQKLISKLHQSLNQT